MCGSGQLWNVQCVCFRSVVGNEDQFTELLHELERRNLIKQTEHGGFMRVVQFDHGTSLTVSNSQLLQL